MSETNIWDATKEHCVKDETLKEHQDRIDNQVIKAKNILKKDFKCADTTDDYEETPEDLVIHKENVEPSQNEGANKDEPKPPKPSSPIAVVQPPLLNIESLDAQNLGPRAFKLLYDITKNIPNKTKPFALSQKQIAVKLLCSTRTVSRALKELIYKGYIQKTGQLSGRFAVYKLRENDIDCNVPTTSPPEAKSEDNDAAATPVTVVERCTNCLMKPEENISRKIAKKLGFLTTKTEDIRRRLMSDAFSVYNENTDPSHLANKLLFKKLLDDQFENTDVDCTKYAKINEELNLQDECALHVHLRANKEFWPSRFPAYDGLDGRPTLEKAALNAILRHRYTNKCTIAAFKLELDMRLNHGLLINSWMKSQTINEVVIGEKYYKG